MNQLCNRLLSRSNINLIRCLSITEQKLDDNKRRWFIGLCGGIVLFGGYNYVNAKDIHAETKQEITIAGHFRKDLPIFSIDEVNQHNATANRKWVMYKQGVYDITQFVEAHPGGKVILDAAGKSIEPFWNVYGIHKNPEVYELIETMRIGNISDGDFVQVQQNASQDPYLNDPVRHECLKVVSQKPFNAEPPMDVLVRSFYTPNEIFYVRNHLPVPIIDETNYHLEVVIEGEPEKKFSFTLDELREKFPKRNVSATLMCAGNRRSEMSRVRHVKGLAWDGGVVGNAVWSGVLLRDLLTSLGVNEMDDYQHVHFEGMDTDPLKPATSNNARYGASIPFHMAISQYGDVLLTFAMNGELLSRDHGRPLRVLVPGVCGARSVKWLNRITVARREESPAFWQRNDYKGFAPSVLDFASADFSATPSIQNMPVTSAICQPQHGDTVHGNHIPVKGYAWSGGGHRIYRVEVSTDAGHTWQNAQIHQHHVEGREWSWTLWSVNVSIPKEEKRRQLEVWCRAVDSNFNSQPEHFAHIWNIRGVLANAYHKITINIENNTSR